MKDYTKFSDAELASILRSGDDAAFKEIYARYSKILYSFAYNKLRSKEESMDVVHDVFARLLQNKETLALKSSLSSYLFRSVLNTVFDLFRHKLQLQKYIDTGDTFIETDSIETDFLIREKEIAEMIASEIAAMPPKMREVYLLKFERHLNAADIAKKLDISVNTVNTHLKRATKHMKDKLGLVIYVVYLLHN